MSDLEKYSEYYAIQAEGYRLGLLPCMRCGATLIIGGSEDTVRIHNEWHDAYPEPR